MKGNPYQALRAAVERHQAENAKLGTRRLAGESADVVLDAAAAQDEELYDALDDLELACGPVCECGHVHNEEGFCGECRCKGFHPNAAYPSAPPREEEVWAPVFEHVQPHSLCCAHCKAADARVADLEAGIRACLASSLRAVPKHILSALTGVGQDTQTETRGS